MSTQQQSSETGYRTGDPPATEPSGGERGAVDTSQEGRDTRGKEARHPAPRTEAPAVSPGDDRLVDADLVLDAPTLSIDELILELKAGAVLDHVRVETRGVQAGLYLKADLDNVVAMVQGEARTASAMPGTARALPRRARRLRGELRELVGATREVFETVGDDVQEPVRRVRDAARKAQEEVGGAGETHAGGEQAPEGAAESHDGRRGDGGPSRMLQVAKDGGKAAGLAAAGAAGVALIESSRHKPALRRIGLPIPRRSSAPKAAIDRVRRRMP